MSTQKRLRFAQIVAETVNVCCPHCGEPQPSPDNGSEAWMPSQIAANQGERVCVSCDERFHLMAQSKAQIVWSAIT